MKKERNYSKGKLYFIRSYQTDDVYIGSTIQTLAERMSGHRAHYKMYIKGKAYYCSAVEILKYPDAYIELIRECPCENIEQLTKLEGEEIRKHACINKRVAGRTKTEYRKDNKEVITEKNKAYKQKNKEKIQKYYEENKGSINEKSKSYYKNHKEKLNKMMKQYREENNKVILCDCGAEIRKLNLSTHLKTNKHQSYLQQEKSQV